MSEYVCVLCANPMQCIYFFCRDAPNLFRYNDVKRTRSTPFLRLFCPAHVHNVPMCLPCLESDVERWRLSLDLPLFLSLSYQPLWIHA